MSKILRAFLISACVTGAAAFVVSRMRRSPQREKLRSDEQPFVVDAESLSEADRQRLIDELDAML